MTSRTARRRARGQRGVALLEFTLVFGLLFSLFAAAIDFGFAWKKSITVAAAIRSAVRVEASLGDDRSAERQALLALTASVGDLGNAQILRVIVFRSTTANGTVPSSCLSLTVPASATGNGNGSASSVCNVYGPAQLAVIATSPTRFDGANCTGSPSDWDRFYCPQPKTGSLPNGREADQGDGADYVGMYVEYRINYVVGVLPGGHLDAEDTAVMRIEPSL